MAIICGADLSLNSTGLALLDNENNTLLDYKIVNDALKSSKPQLDRMFIAIEKILEQIHIWNKQYGIYQVNIEDAVYKRDGWSANPQVTILLSRISGAVLYDLDKNDIKVNLINTQTLKKFILQDEFKAKTAKEDMFNILHKRFGLPEKLTFKNGGNDVTDAIGLCLV